MIREEIDALVALVKVDYEHTLGFVDGVVRVSTSIRTIATAGWFALIAAAVQTQHAWLAVLAATGAAVFGLQDAYHGWLYAEARKRAFEIERLLEDYYKYLQRQSQPGAGTALLKRLHNHRFGQRSRVPSLDKTKEKTPRTEVGQMSKWAERALTSAQNLATVVAAARPKFFYRSLYPSLVVVALIIAALVLGNGDRPSEHEVAQPCPSCRVAPGQGESHSTVTKDEGHP